MQLLCYGVCVFLTGANGQPAHKENLLTVSFTPLKHNYSLACFDNMLSHSRLGTLVGNTATAVAVAVALERTQHVQ
jgi:hypothetical protein